MKGNNNEIAVIEIEKSNLQNIMLYNTQNVINK